MRERKWTGTALGLALCSAALVGCSYSNQSSNETQASSNAAGGDVQVDWNSQTEQQLREAIANAPANGLKPELFLKGGEKGAALTQAAVKYASALANGYSDPKKLFRGTCLISQCRRPSTPLHLRSLRLSSNERLTVP